MRRMPKLSSNNLPPKYSSAIFTLTLPSQSLDEMTAALLEGTKKRELLQKKQKEILHQNLHSMQETITIDQEKTKKK